MATLAVKSIVANCLGKTGRLSIKQDVLGVYSDDNPQSRSLATRLRLIESRPFIRIAVVSITDVNGVNGTVIQDQNLNLQRDIDNANEIIQRECDAWIYVVATDTVDRPDLLAINQNSCPLGIQDNPTADELALFALGRDLGADLVAYYIQNGPGGVGCSAFPAGQRGFWVDNGASQWTFAHELVHVVGLNPHPNGDANVPNPQSDNLMSTPTSGITSPPPDLTNNQRDRFLDDPEIESCAVV